MPMSDRPDWLPEPTRAPARPLGERLHLAAASVISLLLGVFGTIFLLIGVMQLVRTGPNFNPRLFPRDIAVAVAPGLLFLATAYLMRWCLRRVRIESKKSRTLPSEHTQSD
jgi:hypothetical protein